MRGRFQHFAIFFQQDVIAGNFDDGLTGQANNRVAPPLLTTMYGFK